MTKTVILEDIDVSIADEEEDKRYVDKLNRNIDKVKYLRLIKGYTQERAANIAGISPRHLQRIEKNLKMS
ncbi:helix-turn-helix domain-containing protein [Clostridium botulinum]|uniref:Helix-turn-helix transcriptional regulator n=1 Tax=Clostridium botulinum TaxID=1491 RepID=A0A846KI50_CLOBO|nr:helix-turn-helix transcriptional regulator [Clostridium botulinum]AIY82192.1 helix-turn-helix family protein [Clostridium botulinum 202F]EES47882.1 DNA-directed RNA polymerase specialized sigma subunit [Clostridium botulinum E1 str. 'BoNT E Beluga']KAI3344494.1 helix-turn-helix domain-containing protein [Clostridium botulinum]KON13505.1 RNA polymerase sigma factor [Clostridium botulinum]MBN1050286.1 XRE family transcriptional regulator [Clostridium botulinum]